MIEKTKKLTTEEREALKKVADKFLKEIKEIVNLHLWTENVDGLGRLVTQIHILQDHEVLDILREKGFDKEITELCDKAGQIK